VSASVSERPPAIAQAAQAEANDDPTPEDMAKAKRVMKIALVLGMVGAVTGAITGYSAPGSARNKLGTWQRADALVTDIDVRGSIKRRKTYVSLAYEVNGQVVETEINEGRSSDRKVGEKVAILVSPKDMQETEYASNVEAMAKNSPVAGLFRGGAIGFFALPFMIGILALVALNLKQKFTRKTA
jgi:hypothetical protein